MFEAFTCQLSETYCYSSIISLQLVSTFLYYFPATVGLFLLFRFWKKDFFMPSRINKKFPPKERVMNELKRSFSTYLIFVVLNSLLFIGAKKGWIGISVNFSDFSIPYLIVSFFALVIIHETWFYWMHRTAHFKAIFKHVHHIHHMSVNPSPLASHSFNFVEALLEYAYLPIFLIFFSTHPVVIFAEGLLTMTLNIYIHSGYEFLPSGWTTGKLSKWFNSSVHHNMHHSRSKGNYSLYLNFWDRVCGTNHPQYTEYFEKVVAQRDQELAARGEIEGALGNN